MAREGALTPDSTVNEPNTLFHTGCSADTWGSLLCRYLDLPAWHLRLLSMFWDVLGSDIFNIIPPGVDRHVSVITSLVPNTPTRSTY